MKLLNNAHKESSCKNKKKIKDWEKGMKREWMKIYSTLNELIIYKRYALHGGIMHHSLAPRAYWGMH